MPIPQRLQISCNFYIFFILMLIYADTLGAQVLSRRCLQDQILAENPKTQMYRKATKAAALDLIDSDAKELNGNMILVPTVFHIIHTGEDIGDRFNISESLITAQLGQLNDDFRRQNQNASHTPVFFSDIASDAQIEFCLSSDNQTTEGTIGINRINISDLDNVSLNDCWTSTYIDQRIVKPTTWDTNRFLNIYIVPKINATSANCAQTNVLGYAHYPGLNHDVNVVVAVYFSVGSLHQPNPELPIYQGRTVTHEVGHWFDLDHLWGYGSGGCNQDDGFGDTPPQHRDSGGLCPDGTVLTDYCTTTPPGIQYMNYMDYTNDACLNMFSHEQTEYMRAVILSGRPGLINSPCSASLLPISWLQNPKAESKAHQIKISWKANLDNQHDYFVVEHSTDGEAFSRIHQIEENKIEYSWFHATPKQGINYYRVKAIDRDGLEQVSTVTNAFHDRSPYASVYPNPAHHQLLINTVDDQYAECYIINSSGQKVMNQKICLQNNILDISHLNTGIYFVDYKGKMSKFIKL